MAAVRRTTARADEVLPGAPGYSGLATAAGIAGLFLKCVRLAVRPPYSWRREAIAEAALAVRRCAVPIVLSSLFFAIGLVVFVLASLIDTLGTPDRLIGAIWTGWVREPATWVAMMIAAGVAGSAITADIAARKIRDELDALSVLGVDRIRTLVVPRVIGMTLVTPLLGVFVLATAMIAQHFGALLRFQDLSAAASLDTARAFFDGRDVLNLTLKLLVIGAFIGVTSTYKGLTATGGAEGVGRAVNEAVVTMFIGLWLLNSVWNTAFLALFPDVQALRG